MIHRCLLGLIELTMCANRTIVIAGHDTTAGTVSWLLYELSKHPKDQDRLREEIREHRRRLAPGEDFSDLDYEAMPVLNATLKVCFLAFPRRTSDN